MSSIFYMPGEIIPITTTFKNHWFFYKSEKLFSKLDGDVFYKQDKNVIKSMKNPLFKLQKVSFRNFILYKGAKKQVWSFRCRNFRMYWEGKDNLSKSIKWIEGKVNPDELESFFWPINGDRKQGYIFRGIFSYWVYPIIFSKAYSVLFW